MKARTSDSRYLRLWRAVPRELGFLLLTLPIALVGFVVAMALLGFGLGTLITFFIGIFVFARLFWVSRKLGTLELVRLRWAGMPPIERPEWPRDPGFWGWVRTMFSNRHNWLYALHTALINYLVSTVTWTVTVVWLALGLGGVTQWFWTLFLSPQNRYLGYFSRWLNGVFGGDATADQIGGLSFRALDNILAAVLGLILLATLPFVTRGLVTVHYGIARLTLSASPAHPRGARKGNESPDTAVSGEVTLLRRGDRQSVARAQKNLELLCADLASAERQLDSDPEAVRALLGQSRALAQETLDGLRDVTQDAP